MKSKIISGKLEPIVVYRRDGAARTAGAITKAKGGYVIADTSTTAKKGDIYRPETATTSLMVGKEYKIIDASTNSFTIASKNLPTLGDTFYILGPTTQRVGSDGAVAVTVSGGATEAKQDTQITHLNNIETAVEAIQGNNFNQLGTLDTSVNTLLKPASTLAAVTTVGTVSSVTAIANALPAGTNNIGDVDVLSLPAIPAGTNNIGDVDVLTLPAIPTGTNVIGRVGIDQTTPGTTNLVALAANQSVNVAQINGVTTLMGNGATGTGSIRVTIADNNSAIPTVTTVTTVSTVTNVSQFGGVAIGLNANTVGTGTLRTVLGTGATGTTAAVADSATSVTLLAASTSRLGAIFFNDSTQILYLKFGATASTTSFAVKIQAQGYYELPGPHIYNGIVDGIWAANASGNCLVTSW